MGEDEEAELLDPDGSGYDLANLRVLHSQHPLQSDPADVSSTVRLGFKWAEIPVGQGLFLCTCAKKCLDPEHCGRTFFDQVIVQVGEHPGHKVDIAMPWSDGTGSGDLVVFEVWCCPNCEVVGTGSTMDVWVGRFYDIPARLLQYEHETRSRSYAGLRKSMGKAYPDEFTEGSFVTLVLYRRVT